MQNTGVIPVSTYLQEDTNNQPSTTPAPQQTSQGASNPSFLARLLPAIGGIAGGALGSLSDVVTGPLGSIGGAAAGSALGKSLEDKLSGQAGGNGVLGAAIAGGAGQGVGELAGGALSAIGGGLSKVGTKAATDLTSQASNDAANAAMIAEQTAMKNNYGAIAPKLQTAWKLGDSTQLAKTLQLDATNPQSLQAIGQANKPFSGVLNEALSTSKPIDVSNVTGNLDSYATKQGSTFSTTTGIKDTNTGNYVSQLNNDGAAVTNDINGALTDAGIVPNASQATPEQVKAAQQNIGKLINNAETDQQRASASNTVNPIADARANALHQAYNDLGQNLYSDPAIDKAIAAKTLSPEEEAAVYQQVSNPSVAKYAIDTINNAQTHQDILQPMQQSVYANKAGNLAQGDIEQAVGTARAVARTKQDVAPQNNGNTKAGGLMDVVGGGLMAAGHPFGIAANIAARAQNAGLTPHIAQGLGGVLSKIAPLAGAAGVAAASVPGLGGTPQNNVSSNIGAEQSAMQNSPLIQEYNQLQQQSLAAPTVLGSQLAPVLAGLAPKVQQFQTAAPELSNLATAFGNAGGAQGTAGGFLSQLSALVPGTAANTYQRQQQATANVLAQILGISPEAAQQLTPQLMQSQVSANIAGNNLNSVLGGITAGQ